MEASNVGLWSITLVVVGNGSEVCNGSYINPGGRDMMELFTHMVVGPSRSPELLEGLADMLEGLA